MLTYDDDPDDTLEARWLRDHDGAPALEPQHPEEEAYECLMAMRRWIPVQYAVGFFANALDDIENGGSDEFPF